MVCLFETRLIIDLYVMAVPSVDISMLPQWSLTLFYYVQFKVATLLHVTDVNCPFSDLDVETSVQDHDPAHSHRAVSSPRWNCCRYSLFSIQSWVSVPDNSSCRFEGQDNTR